MPRARLIQSLLENKIHSVTFTSHIVLTRPLKILGILTFITLLDCTNCPDSVRAEGLGEVLTEISVLVVAGPEPPGVVVVVAVVVLAGPGPCQTPDVSHKRFVLRPAGGVVDLPAAVTEIVEATLLPAEVRALLQEAHTAEAVLQVWVHLRSHFLVRNTKRSYCTDLNLLPKPGGFDLYKGC